MNAIIIILLTSLILYKIGAVSQFLDFFTLYGSEEAETVTAYTTPQKQRPTITEREKLEMQAAAVVAAMGEDSRTVAYMSEGLLRALINDYTQANR